MKTVRLHTLVGLFLLFILSVILPVAGHSDAYTNLLSWTGWWSSSKTIETWDEASGEISKLSFIGGSPPLHLTYDLKRVDENSKIVSDLENNQLYIILDGQPGDLFNFCFRTPPALLTGNVPSLPTIRRPLTFQGIPGIENLGMRRLTLAPDTDRWQHEYSASLRLPVGNQSLVLSIEDNVHGWAIEPECSGIVSESTVSPSPSGRIIYNNNPSNNQKKSSVDIIFRNTRAVKNGSGYLEHKSHFSGPLAIPGTPDIADNGKSFISSGDGGFSGGDDLDDLFKKRPGNGMAPLYSFEWTSEPVSRMILVPVHGSDGQTVKKQIWDNQIVLKIKQGWNEQVIIISQELWNKIRGANLEQNPGLFLTLSRNPDNLEAAIDHYLKSNPAPPLQKEDYRRYTRQEFILGPKRLRSVSVFPGHCPTGVSCSGGTSQVDKEMALSTKPPTNTQFQEYYRHNNQGSSNGRRSGGDDGSGGSPNSVLCRNCNKPAIAFNKCHECLNRESNLVEEGAAKESNPVIKRDSEIMVSKEDVNYSAIRIFQWFQNLKFDGRKRGDYFHINDYYKFPELYNLLTQSFMSDKDTLSKFHSKWVRFLNGSFSIYHLISEVGELAKSQGVENYAEVTRIVKALALKRDEFESKLSLERFGNELSNCLTRNNLLGADESTQNLYSGLDSKKKLELINSIYKVFEQLGNLLQSEIFPSEYITIRMLNALARDIYYKYLFGIPAINDESLELENIMWGFSGHNQYSFITSYNSEILHQLHSYEPLQTLALSVSSDGSSNLEEVRAMFTVVALVRSMLAQRLRAIFPEHALFAKDVPHEQLKLLSNFSLNASERLVLMLDHTKPEEKDEFIRNMFLIFGMVPRHLSDELSGQWDPESVPLTQAAAHATGPLYQQPKRRTAKSVIMESVLSQWELLNIGYKLGDDWKNFAINTDVISYDAVRVIDANFVGVVDKTMQMLERWKQRKGRITFKDLMVILDKIKRDDLRREIMEYYGL